MENKAAYLHEDFQELPPCCILENPPPPCIPTFQKNLFPVFFARCYHRDHVEIESFLNLLIASEGSTAAVTELVRYIFCQLLGKTLFIELCSYTFNISKIL